MEGLAGGLAFGEGGRVWGRDKSTFSCSVYCWVLVVMADGAAASALCGNSTYDEPRRLNKVAMWRAVEGGWEEGRGCIGVFCWQRGESTVGCKVLQVKKDGAEDLR